jgi:hypothetical protein
MSLEQLLTTIYPLLVWLAAWIIDRVTPYFGKANGLIIVGIIVPVLSAVGIWLLGLIQPGTEWYLQFFYNVSAVFVNELVKQIKKVTEKPVE